MEKETVVAWGKAGEGGLKKNKLLEEKSITFDQEPQEGGELLKSEKRG